MCITSVRSLRVGRQAAVVQAARSGMFSPKGISRAGVASRAQRSAKIPWRSSGGCVFKARRGPHTPGSPHGQGRQQDEHRAAGAGVKDELWWRRTGRCLAPQIAGTQVTPDSKWSSYPGQEDQKHVLERRRTRSGRHPSPGSGRRNQPRRPLLNWERWIHGKESADGFQTC